MSKSKRIAEDIREGVTTPTEKTLEQTPSTPKIIKMKGLTNELNDSLVNYLSSKPYAEVSGLLISLSQAPVLEVTLNGSK